MGRWRWKCTHCGCAYAPGEAEYLCPRCAGDGAAGASLRGVLRAEYGDCGGFPCEDSVDGAESGAGGAFLDHRRYLDLLPLADPRPLPPLPVGPTPLLACERLRERLGLPRLYVKNDALLPTGSLKDRASSLVVARARERGDRIVVTASTGNAATSLAGMCAAAGLRAVVLVPGAAPREKLIQMLHYGAMVCPIEGSYDEAFALCLAAGAEFGWYNRSTAFNPYTIEGKKTVAFEIWEQLGRRAPQAVVVPVGDGVILAGVEKGFADLHHFGLIDRLPRLIAVQAEGSAAIVRAWQRGDAEVSAVAARTAADSICVGSPANGSWALRALRATEGRGVTVADDEILSAMHLMASLSGIYAEPAAAAPLAGLVRLAREVRLDPAETIVLLVTGSGLKDTRTAMQAVRLPAALPPTLEAVRERVERELRG